VNSYTIIYRFNETLAGFIPGSGQMSLSKVGGQFIIVIPVEFK
jgi:hypothetical protein